MGFDENNIDRKVRGASTCSSQWMFSEMLFIPQKQQSLTWLGERVTWKYYRITMFYDLTEININARLKLKQKHKGILLAFDH